MTTVISVENISKLYRLGLINTGTLSHDLNRWWARLRGKPDPLLKIGQQDHGNRTGEYIWALRDVSLEVKQGEVLGIIGRNGAGKSTLLKILSQVTAPTSGQVKVKGRIASLLEVGTGFHPELTGRENIFLNGAILGMTKAEIRHKFDEIVAFAEVEKFIDTPVKHYSSGMYVRLAFAVAAHLEPEILLVDEVLAVGDAAFQKKCLGKMGDVAREGRTVLLVSHNMGAVESLCMRGILLDEGQLVFDGERTTAISKYLEDSQARTDIPLAVREDHLGNGSLRIVDISLGLEGQSDCGYWRTGENCVVRFSYQVDGSVQRHVDIGFSLADSSGRKLLFANTIVYKKCVPIRREEGVLYCSIERFPLSPGKYYLTYDVFYNGELLDKVESAIVVHVESRDGIETWASWGGYGVACSKYEWGHE